MGRPPKEPLPPPPTFQELNAPSLPDEGLLENARFHEVVRSDMNVLNFVADKLKRTWDCASPHDVQGVCALSGMTLRVLEMRRRVLMLPLGNPGSRDSSSPSQSSGLASLYDD